MLRYKWLFIIGITVLSIVAFMPWERDVRLGLDLKGGIHLIVRVVTDDAIRAELDGAVSQIKADFEGRKLVVGSVERTADAETGVYRVVVTGVPGDSFDVARRRVDALLPEYRRSSEEDRIYAEMPKLWQDRLRDETVEQARSTIRERIDQTGVAEAVIVRQGLRGDRILIQIPGVKDPEYVKRLIGRVAFLELKLVAAGPFSTRQAALDRYQGVVPGTLELLEGLSKSGDQEFHVTERVPIITGSDLSRAQPGRDRLNQWSVEFNLRTAGARKFSDATGKNVGRQLAIVLDNRIESAPRINGRISDRGVIEGSFTEAEARELALVLRAGALPAKIQYLEERTVDPWLGKEAIHKGVFTGIGSIVVLVLLMILYYRGAGVNASVALVLNGILLLGVMSVLKATLTLPGIAGFILALGMAVDANVLVFEAIRENLRNGQAVRRAVDGGFARALITILDANFTTILAAGSLWMLGSGPVRGFGITLFLGLVINIFTAYFVSKTMFETFVLSREWKPGDHLSI